jgi:hypothetical protein
MIEEELKSDLTPQDKLPKLQKVLGRINQVESTEKNVKHVTYIRDNPFDNEGIHHVTEKCKDYPDIILYGISTSVCLPFVKQKLENAGHNVKYDNQGVID